MVHDGVICVVYILEPQSRQAQTVSFGEVIELSVGTRVEARICTVD